MNEQFVTIKVDREERPDLDQIYMAAVQAMTGHGGWPMTVFLTPDGRAVLRRHLFPAGRPPRPARLPPRADAASPTPTGSGAASVEQQRRRAARAPAPSAAALPRPAPRAADAGRARRARLERAAAGVRRRARRLRRRAQVPAADDLRVPPALLAAHRRRAGAGDGRAHADAAWPRAASTTSSAAASTATRPTTSWLVPHFEKMLYDNALLARLYLHAYQATGESVLPAHRRGDAGLRAARDDQPGGRLLLDPGRRQRGRGGQVLRLGRPPRSRRLVGEAGYGAHFGRHTGVTPNGEIYEGGISCIACCS